MGSRICTLPTLISKWESELKRFFGIDPEYVLGKHQRRQIVYKSLPKEIKERIDTETSLKRLETYELFIAFVETYATSVIYSEKPKPQQFTANAVTASPPPANQTFTVVEWINYLGTPEGAKYVEDQGELDANGYEAYFSVMKGNKGGKNGYKGGGPKGGYKSYNPKGGYQSPKGGGKGPKGGKGKGGFRGKCWNCEETGHTSAECTKPKKSINGVFDWQPGNQSAENSYELSLENKQPVSWYNIGTQLNAVVRNPVQIRQEVSPAVPRNYVQHFPTLSGSSWFPQSQCEDNQQDESPSCEESCSWDETGWQMASNRKRKGQKVTAETIRIAKAKMSPIVRVSQKDKAKALKRRLAAAEEFNKQVHADIKDSEDEFSEGTGEVKISSDKVVDRSINGIFPVYDSPPGPILVAEQEELVWIKVGVAVDSGACAHVTPASVFSMTSVLGDGPTFYAANGAPIRNFGTQQVKAVLDDASNIDIKFNVADIARPLLSVFEINSKGFFCVFGEDYAYLEKTSNGNRIPLRLENKLYFLDMWLEVPKSMTENDHFGRQA